MPLSRRAQVATKLALPAPPIRRILGRMAQLTNGRPETFAKPGIELDRAKAEFA